MTSKICTYGFNEVEDVNSAQILLTRLQSMDCEISTTDNDIQELGLSIISINTKLFKRVVITEENLVSFLEYQLNQVKGYYIFNNQINLVFSYQ